MAKRKVDDEEDYLSLNKFSKKVDSDEDDDDDDSDDGKKYEILKEDDIEGQEAGVVTNEGDVQITPFNMKEEMEEGHFDSEGMYHWNKEENVRDNWLENIDWIKIKEGDANATKKQESDSEDDSQFDTISNYKQVLQYMKEGETVARTLRRLGGTKSLSASERLKRKKAGIAIDKNDEGDKEAVNKVTELANSILTRSGNMDIYQETFEEISNKVNQSTKKETAAAPIVPELDMYADDFDEKEKAGLSAAASSSTDDQNALNTEKPTSTGGNSESEVQWELKRDLKAEKIEGPYSTLQMNQWIHSNHFETSVWVRKVGSNTEFYSSKRVDFELYL